MKKLFYLLLLVLLLAVPTMMIAAQDAAVTEAPAAQVVADRVVEFGTNLPRGYGLISVDDLAGMLKVQDLVLLDVREPAEYEAGHLEGAFNVPLRTLAQNLDLLPDTNASIVVICKGGGRAMLAATSLEILGYSNVKVLKGGYDAWAGEDLATTTDAFTVEAGTAPELNADVLAAVDNYLSNLPQGFAMVTAPNLMAELVSDPLPETGSTACCKVASSIAPDKTAPALLIDVRTDDEWAKGYIAGAQHLPIDDFVNHIADLPTDKATPIVVYCQSGYRGGIAAVMLNVLGYTNVLNLAGGLNAWSAAGLPLVMPS